MINEFKLNKRFRIVRILNNVILNGQVEGRILELLYLNTQFEAINRDIRCSQNGCKNA